MEEKENNEKLIGELIKKRKKENDAFLKLLSAIENIEKGNVPEEQPNPKRKSKS